MLPYDTPAPADIDKLMSGELVSTPRLLNPSIPRAISDIVLRAMAPEVTDRYQRASDLLDDVLGARTPPAPDDLNSLPTPAASDGPSRVPREDAGSLQSRLASARIAGRALLLAVPQAAARPQRSLPVL